MMLTNTTILLVFSLAMATICLACYSNWFRKRVDGYLWRCVFWSPVILVVCVARQVSIIHYFIIKQFNSFQAQIPIGCVLM